MSASEPLHSSEPIPAEIESIEESSSLGSVTERAIEVIGSRDEALRWLGIPVRALDYAAPISLLGDEEGVKAVLAVLDQLEQGVW